MPLSTRWRLPRQPNYLAFLVVLGGGVPALASLGMPIAVMLAFDVAAMVFLAMSAPLLRGGGAGALRDRAARYDGGHAVIVLTVVLVALVVSLALTLELSAAVSMTPRIVALPALTLALVWVFVAVLFALRYAHAYYAKPEGGVRFPGPAGEEPDGLDFLYLSVTIGTAFAVSDVVIEGRRIRRTVLVQAVVSFAFNVFVLALAIGVLGSAL